MLCIIDSSFAGLSLIEYGMKKGFKLLTYTTPIYVNIWPTIVYPLHNITYSLSIFITLAIAIERYIQNIHLCKFEQRKLAKVDFSFHE